MQHNKKQLSLDIKIAKKAPEWEDFIIDKSNSLAFTSISSDVKNWLSYLLIISGPSGCGKSMLLNLWSQRNNATIIENFQDMENVILNKDQLKTPLLFAIDMDMQKLKELQTNKRFEEIFFHFLNFLKNNNGKLLLVTKTNPDKWGLKTKDLASRLNAANIIEISQPSDDLLVYGLQKILSDKQIKVDNNTIKYVINHTERSFSHINQMADTIEEIAEENKSKISIQKLKKKLP